MHHSLTTQQKEALVHLVRFRHAAKKTVLNKTILNSNIAILEDNLGIYIRKGDLKQEALTRIDLNATRERLLEIRFRIIELGKAFVQVSYYCESQQVPREDWLRALSVNESEWHTDDMREYGSTVANVVSVLDLENSATKEDAIEHKPIKWCCTMAMMNAMKTNPKFGEFAHNAANEMFNGAFGDYHQPSDLERLGVRNAPL